METKLSEEKKIKDMRIAKIAKIVIFAVILMVLAVALLVDDKEPVKTVLNKDEVKLMYLTGCLEAGKCAFQDCVFEGMYKEIGLEGIVKMANESTKTGVFPKSYYSVIAGCQDKL